MTRLAALAVGGEISPWARLGFSVSDNQFCVADVAVRFDGAAGGIVGWSFVSDRTAQLSVDGIPTDLVTQAPCTPGSTSHLGVSTVIGLDHVVVNTDDPSRTCAAIEKELGLPVRRVRELGNGATQTFHKADNTVIEVVSGPHVTHTGARLWGMVASVDDVEGFAADAATRLGSEMISPPKPAVQPGRFISTVRSEAGLGVPFAVMSPHVPTLRAD